MEADKDPAGGPPPALDRAAIREWARGRGVPLVVLFGSRAAGSATTRSDWDLAVWPPRTTSPEERIEWQSTLGRALDADVDLVVVTSRVDPVLGFEISRSGVPLVEGEPGSWSRARLILWHRYLDSEPFRDAARRQLSRFVAERAHGA